MTANTSFEDRIAIYFRDRLGYEAAHVVEARRLSGGISRETWGVRLVHGCEPNRHETAVVLRLDPIISLLPSNRHVEFALFRAFEADGSVPVPHAIVVEDDPSALGATFLATLLLEGTAAIPAIVSPPYVSSGTAIAQRAFELLAAIGRLDWREHGLNRVLSAPHADTAWSTALDYWQGVLDTHSLGPAPVIRMAIRALRREPPPPPSAICVVHGDYRLGNILYTENGAITGVLDWEMAHLGDPLEDLAWALDPKWRPRAAAEKVFAHLDTEEAVSIYERARGEPVDRRALGWWLLFARFKAAVLWTTAGYSFLNQKADDMIQCMVAWHGLSLEDRAILGHLGIGAP